jgi:hypothetical protein
LCIGGQGEQDGRPAVRTIREKGGQNMTLPQSIFGGLALIAIAIYVGKATNTADAQDQSKPTPEIRFQLMAPFGYEATGYVFRVDSHTAQVSLCAGPLNNLKDTPQCTPWSGKEVIP